MVPLLVSVLMAASLPTTPAYQQAEALVNDFEFESAIVLLLEMAGDADVPATDRAHCYAMAGSLQVNLLLNQDAVRSFERAVALDPHVALPSSGSPDAATMLEEARANAPPLPPDVRALDEQAEPAAPDEFDDAVLAAEDETEAEPEVDAAAPAPRERDTLMADDDAATQEAAATVPMRGVGLLALASSTVHLLSVAAAAGAGVVAVAAAVLTLTLAASTPRNDYIALTPVLAWSQIVPSLLFYVFGATALVAGALSLGLTLTLVAVSE